MTENQYVETLTQIKRRLCEIQCDIDELLSENAYQSNARDQDGESGDGSRPLSGSTGGDLYDRFTDRSRKVMQLANQEAQRFNHEYLGTEHVLLGLVRHGDGIAASVIKAFDIDLRKVRLEVEKRIQSGPEVVIVGRLPFTPRTKKVIEYSMEEARNLNHNYVGTEHILLGLLREQEGVGAIVLRDLGMTHELVRKEVKALIANESGEHRGGAA